MIGHEAQRAVSSAPSPSDTRRPYRFLVPTLAETSALARERRALSFLEIKGPGMDEEVAPMLTTADLWDDVVYLHHRNSEGRARGPRPQGRQYQPSPDGGPGGGAAGQLLR